jgi:hypothetical protein
MNICTLVSKARGAGLIVDLADGSLQVRADRTVRGVADEHRHLAAELRTRQHELRGYLADQAIYEWSEPLETWVWTLANSRTASALQPSHRMMRAEPKPGVVKWCGAATAVQRSHGRAGA